MNIQKELKKFGLTEKQTGIYVLLLRKGSLRISEIVQMLHIPRSSVYENLRELLKLGLAEEVIEDNFKSIQAYPVGALRYGLQEKIDELEARAANLDGLEKALASLQGAKTSDAPVIRYYRGKSGARQLYWNSLKAKNTIYVQSVYGRSKYLGKKFYMDFVAESYARNIREKILINPTPHAIDLIKRDTGTPLARSDTTNIRAISEENVLFKGDTLMYDNIYAQAYLHDEEITGFEIESNQFVDTQRAIFKMLWNAANPISQYV